MMAMTTHQVNYPELPGTVTTGIPFGRLLRVEWRKGLDTRAARWLLAGVLVLTVAAVTVAVFRPQDVDQTVSGYLSTAGYGSSVLLPVIAILTLTTEWSRHTVLSTYTAEPRRGRVLAAKICVGAGLAALGTVLAYGMAAAGLAASAAAGREVTWTLPAADVVGVAAYLLLSAAMAVAFGALLHNTAAAIVAYFALPGVIAGIGAASSWVQKWLDTATTFDWALRGEWEGHVGPVAVTAAIWIVLPLAGGVVRTLRREVT